MRKDDADGEPAIGHRMGIDAGLVGDGDGSDDGESEAVPVLVLRPPRVEPLEGLEETVDFRRRDERSGVGHRQHGLAFLHSGHDLDAAVDDVLA